MKKLILVFLFFLALWFSFAQTSNPVCNNDWYVIDWYDNVKRNQFLEYSIKTSDWNQPFLLKWITYKFFDNDKVLDVSKTDTYATYFKSLWAKKLQVEFSDDNGCNYKISKNITVYEKLIVYIWDSMDEFQLGFDENFQKHSIFFDKILLDSISSISNDDLTNKILENVWYLKSSDNIVISTQVFDRIFDVFQKLVKSDLIDFSKKNMYLIWENKLFMKRTLTKYLKPFKDPNIFVVEKNYLLNFLSDLSFDKTSFDPNYISNISLDSWTQSKFMFVSHAVDYLIYQWMSINIISFLLLLSLSILVISFLRQFIGLSIFGLFYPLVFSLSLLFVWIKLSLVLLLITFISTMITKFIVKKIYLLYNAKIALLMILYICFLFWFMFLDSFLWLKLIDFQLFDNMFVIFPLIFIAIIWDKIFNDGFRLFSLWSLFSLMEFLLVSFLSYFLLDWSSARHMMIAYPEIILFIFILNIILWRFTGLQFLEYFRFIPLIKKQFEEE